MYSRNIDNIQFKLTYIHSILDTPNRFTNDRNNIIFSLRYNCRLLKKVNFHRIFKDKSMDKTANCVGIVGILGGKFHLKQSLKNG